MIRFLIYSLVAILLIGFIRMVMGVIGKGMAELFNPSEAPQQPGPKRPTPPAGELKQDPVCGTYVSTATAFQKAVSGQTLYFCSVECRDKHK